MLMIYEFYDKDCLQNMVVDFFLFTNEWINTDISLPNLFHEVNIRDLSFLNNPVEDWEIKKAFFNIGSYKAPSIDGYPAVKL